MSKTYLYHKGQNKPYGELILYDEVVVTDQGKTFALVIGHDSKLSGAIGADGINEFDFNNQLVQDLLPMLPSKHTYHVFYRNENIRGYSNQMDDLHKRIDAKGCDISIEFHFNGSDNPSVNGFEALYYSKGGKEVADKLVMALDANLPTNNRGSKVLTNQDNGYGFVSKGKSLAIITESFFGANQHRFVDGGEYRSSLKLGYKEFFESL